MSPENPVSGILLVNKPVGITSFKVVSVVRRLFGLRRVGHCGTLDPFADGLLPIVIGRATRAVFYMDRFDKAYQVRIRFGRSTDTMDLTGNTLEEQPISAQRMRQLASGEDRVIYDAVESLTGLTSQIPPMYSAVKIEGRALYDYARAGQDIERRERPITIRESVVLSVATDEEGLYADVRIRCSKGTYIRSLADLVGRTTGLFAHASALTRLDNGPYSLAQAVSWPDIMAAIDSGVQLPLLPVETAFVDYPHLYLDDLRTTRLIQGQSILASLPSATVPGGFAADSEKPLVAVFSSSGFVGLARIVEEGTSTATSGQADKMDESTLDGTAGFIATTDFVLTAERMFIDLEHHTK